MLKLVLHSFQRNWQNLITQSDGDWSSTTGQMKLHYKHWESWSVVDTQPEVTLTVHVSLDFNQLFPPSPAYCG